MIKGIVAAVKESRAMGRGWWWTAECYWGTGCKNVRF